MKTQVWEQHSFNWGLLLGQEQLSGSQWRLQEVIGPSQEIVWHQTQCKMENMKNKQDVMCWLASIRGAGRQIL